MALFTPAASALMTAVGDTPAVDRPAGQLIAAAIVGIAVIIVLITWVKLHPFLSLTIGSKQRTVLAVNRATAAPQPHMQQGKDALSSKSILEFNYPLTIFLSFAILCAALGPLIAFIDNDGERIADLHPWLQPQPQLADYLWKWKGQVIPPVEENTPSFLQTLHSRL